MTLLKLLPINKSAFGNINPFNYTYVIFGAFILGNLPSFVVINTNLNEFNFKYVLLYNPFKLAIYELLILIDFNYENLKSQFKNLPRSLTYFLIGLG